MRFGGMNSGVQWVGKEQTPGPPTWAGVIFGHAIGAPSAGLSLVGVLASRARLRFTRPAEDSARPLTLQDQNERAGWSGPTT
jgi:hypothetical protein